MTRVWLALALVLAVGQAIAQGRVCGTALLRQRPPQPLAAPKVLATAQDGPVEVGTQRQFVHTYSPSTPVEATCRAVGEHAYIFVEDRRWDENGGLVDQGHVDVLLRLFEEATPADSERGIFDIGVEAFGVPADVDGDPRIFILILDIGEPNVIGFFDPQVATHPVPAFRRDMLFLDEFFVRRQSYLARGTLAHEFQHLIHYGHDEDEEVWVEEGLSGYAEELAGYPEADPLAVPAYLQTVGAGLFFPPRGVAAGPRFYGGTYLFFSFMAERYGGGFVRSLVAEPRNGISGIDAVLAQTGAEAGFAETWGLWRVGNYAFEDPRYGYRALGPRQAHRFVVDGLPEDRLGDIVAEQWGAVNVLLRLAGDIEVEFFGDENGRFAAWLYAWSGGQGQLHEIALDTANRGIGQVSGVDSLALIVGRTSLNGPAFEFGVRRFIPTAVAAGAVSSPEVLAMEAAFPNPFNSAVRIPIRLASGLGAEVVVYDVLGRAVRRWMLEGMGGTGEVLWDGRDDAGRAVGSGIYALQLRQGGRTVARRVSLIR